MSDKNATLSLDHARYSLLYHAIFEYRLTAVEFVTYCALLSFADFETQIAFPSHKTIAARANVSVAASRRAIERLIEVGLVEKTQRRRANRSQTSNHYTVKTPVAQTLVAQTDGHRSHRAGGGDSQSIPEQESFNKTSADADVTRAVEDSTAKSKKPRARNLHFDAIVEAFAYDPATLTRTASKNIGRIAAELKAAGCEPDEVLLVKRFGDAQNWSGGFTENALVKLYPRWRAQSSSKTSRGSFTAGSVYDRKTGDER